MSQEPKRLYRSRTDRKLFGVLGGVAQYFGLDPSFVRIVYLILLIFTMVVPGTLLYWAMFFIIPIAPKTEAGQPPPA